MGPEAELWRWALGWAWLDTATSGFRHHGMFARSVPTPGSGGTKLQAQGLRLEEGRESCRTSNLRPEAQASRIVLLGRSTHELETVDHGFSIPTENTRTD